MIKLRRPSNWSGTLLALLCVTRTAALTPTEWQHRQNLDVAAPGLVRVVPTAATFDAAGPQQEDLRIVDANGTELAFLLDRPPVPAAQTGRPESFAVRLETGATVITLATGTTAPLLSVMLETPHPFFLKAARIEISDDAAQWTMLDEGAPLFRQWGVEKLALDLARHRAAYVRLTVLDPRGPALPFTGARLNLAATAATATVPVSAQISRRDEFAGETVLTLTLDGRHMPLAALAFTTKEPLFMRRVTVTVREMRDTVPGERQVGAGTIYRVALNGAPARDQLSFSLAVTPATRELLVHIHNGDSPPLTIDSVQVDRQPVSLLFLAPAAGTYTLLAGNPQATAPHYDLAAFAGELRTAATTDVTPGALQPMPGYQPRTSLATAPLPDVPLLGAPFDAHDWPVRRDVIITQSGVQELELDPAALARTQSGFADLRLLRAGNQIPYVLEKSPLARALTLTPVVAPDPKHPAVSVWQLTLPQAGLPLRRLVLTTSTPLFQRQFRIYEDVVASDGRKYETTLASGDWSRTPEPGASERRIFNLTSRPTTDTLWIETDNGDNPALALGDVQAVYPVVRLIFKVAETDGFTLAYGNKSATAPRYDLSLVAERLLTSGRSVAQLAAAAQDSGPANPFSRINGGVLFWGALALVVIVLLLVVAKLLPKPPDAA